MSGFDWDDNDSEDWEDFLSGPDDDYFESLDNEVNADIDDMCSFDEEHHVGIHPSLPDEEYLEYNQNITLNEVVEKLYLEGGHCNSLDIFRYFDDLPEGLVRQKIYSECSKSTYVKISIYNNDEFFELTIEGYQYIKKIILNETFLMLRVKNNEYDDLIQKIIGKIYDLGGYSSFKDIDPFIVSIAYDIFEANSCSHYCFDFSPIKTTFCKFKKEVFYLKLISSGYVEKEDAISHEYLVLTDIGMVAGRRNKTFKKSK